MKPLIKKLVREELNEISAKSAILTSLMTLGSYGGMKGQTTEPTTTNTIQQQVSTPETIKSEWVDSLTNNQAFGEGKSPDLNFAIELANKNALKSLSKKNKTNNLKNVTKIKGKQFKNSDGYYTAFIVIELENSNDQELETTPAPEVKKTKYGSTPEQRAAAKIKREGQRKINFDNFVMGAYQRANKISGLIELVSDDELKSGCTLADKEEADYIKGNSNDYPKIIYRELKDGRKLKINIKKYQRYIEQHKNDKDVPLDGLNTAKDLKNAEKSNAVDGPSFFDKINPFKERNGCIYSDEDKSGVKK